MRRFLVGHFVANLFGDRHRDRQQHRGADDQIARPQAVLLARLSPIQIAVHTVRERADRDFSSRLALLVIPLRHRANHLLLSGNFLSGSFPVRRCVLDFGIQLGANQDRQPREVEPHQHDDERAERAVRFVVVGEVAEVKMK